MKIERLRQRLRVVHLARRMEKPAAGRAMDRADLECFCELHSGRPVATPLARAVDALWKQRGSLPGVDPDPSFPRDVLRAFEADPRDAEGAPVDPTPADAAGEARLFKAFADFARGKLPPAPVEVRPEDLDEPRPVPADPEADAGAGAYAGTGADPDAAPGPAPTAGAPSSAGSGSGVSGGTLALPADDLLERVRKVKALLEQRVVGQRRAIDALAAAHYRQLLSYDPYTSPTGPGRPLTSLLFLGPPGVGKTRLATELAAASADAGYPVATLVVPMSRYVSPGSEQELTGYGAHYQGGARPGRLTSFAASNQDPCVIVFDEVDRASHEALNLLLELLGEGRLTDTAAQGQPPVSFHHCLVILTSNAGADLWDDPQALGFYREGGAIPAAAVKEALKASTRRESSAGPGSPSFSDAFVDRVQDVVLFAPLGFAEREAILGAALDEVGARLEKAAVELEPLPPSLVTRLALSAGPEASGRDLLQAAQRQVEARVMAWLLGPAGARPPVRRVRVIEAGASSPPPAPPLPPAPPPPAPAPATGTSPAPVVAPPAAGTPPPPDPLELRLLRDVRRLACSLDPGQQQRVADAIAWITASRGHALAIAGAEPPAALLANPDSAGALRKAHPDTPLLLVLDAPDEAALRRAGREGEVAGLLVLRDLPTPEALGEALHRLLRAIGAESYARDLSRRGRAPRFEPAPEQQGDVLELRVPPFAGAADEVPTPSVADVGWFQVKALTPEDAGFATLDGIEAVRDELELAIAFLEDPRRGQAAGVVPPTGYVLHGPPGTGKTSIARAVAAEARALFIACDGTEFQKKFVGEGPERVRELFRVAARYAPVVVFVDEIDSIGSRSTSEGPWRVDVLNAFLSALDGFGRKRGVLVIGATNRLDALDEALLRPGRLGKKLRIDPPRDPAVRRRLIRRYFKGPSALDEPLLALAVRMSAGMSQAEIAGWAQQLGWARLKADRGACGPAPPAGGAAPPPAAAGAPFAAVAAPVATRAFLDSTDLLEARNALLHEEANAFQEDAASLERTAVHEAGHFLVARALGVPVLQVTVVGRGRTLGFVEPDRSGGATARQLRDQLAVLFGGREAEDLLVPGGCGPGAASDMEQALRLASFLACDLGMEKPREAPGGEACVPRPRAGAALPAAGEGAVDQLLRDARREARELLLRRLPALRRLADRLVTQKTVFADEVEDAPADAAQLGAVLAAAARRHRRALHAAAVEVVGRAPAADADLVYDVVAVVVAAAVASLKGDPASVRDACARNRCCLSEGCRHAPEVFPDVLARLLVEVRREAARRTQAPPGGKSTPAGAGVVAASEAQGR